MTKSKALVEDTITKEYLNHSAPDIVFEWLKTNQTLPGQGHPWGRDPDVECLLAAREDPLINLGLALYGICGDVSANLYAKGDLAIQIAVLRGYAIPSKYNINEWLQENFSQLVDEWNEEKLSALFRNPLLSDDVIVAVFEREKLFDSLPEDKWIHLVEQTSLNERLNIPYSDKWMDGYAEYSYNRVFKAAWGLFSNLPVNYESTRILSGLEHRVVHKKPNDMDIVETLKRWNPQTDCEKDKEAFTEVRTALACVIGRFDSQFKDMENDSDSAIRMAYYSKVSQPDPSKVAIWVGRDGKDFLWAAIHSKNFYRTEEVREALRKACWAAPDEHARMDLPNLFNLHCDAFSIENPEWFASEDDPDIDFESITEYELRLEKRIQHLDAQLKVLTEKLPDAEEDADVTSIESYFQEELEVIGKRLWEISSKRGNPVPWLIAGAAAGFALAQL